VRRVAVIGNAAGGKSTLARVIAEAHGLPYHEIDAVLWRADWTAVPEEDFRAWHDAVIEGQTWVLDGFGSWDSVESRFARADTVVLVDLPLWVHFWWAAERQIDWAQDQLDAVPAGHPEPPPNEELFKMIWDLDRQSMPRLREMVAAAERDGKSVYWLRSRRDLAAFQALQER
jgi:adenylate kinase family enzyme